MIPLFKVFMSPIAKDNVAKTLDSGFIGEGPKVKEFESSLQMMFNNYTALTNSATSAEHLILHRLKTPITTFSSTNEVYGISDGIHWTGLDENSEVLATSLTCTASNWPIVLNGLKIKWVDIDPNTLNMDLDDLARKITRHTKVIMMVYWGGYPVDLDRLRSILAEARLKLGMDIIVIQDCAHSILSTYKGRHIADQGFISTFSFQAIKHLTCGDGGAVTAPYKDFIDELKLLRWYGIDRSGPRTDFRCEANIAQAGFKFNMNDIAATIGLSNLSDLKNIVSISRRNANTYNTRLKNIPGVELLETAPDRESSYWIYTIKVKERHNFTKMMTEAGVQVSRVHERNDKHTCVSQFSAILPTLDKISQEMICLPVGWWVSQDDANMICDLIIKGW